MKSTFGDLGSPVPLNMRMRRPMAEATVQKSTHAERIESASRAGTPVTRRGMFNGVMPATTPGIPAELSPLLILKAVVNPADAGSGSGDSVSRKRDPGTGKFADNQNAGPVSTAEDDAAAQQRTQRLAGKRYLKALGVPDAPLQKRPETPMEQAGIANGPPGQNGIQPDAGGQPPMPQPQVEQPMGTTPDGQPVYDDPYHEGHANFTADHHDGAAQLHQQMAEQMTAQGRIPSAMEHQMKASIHGEMGRDAMSPMARLAMDQQGVQGLEGAPGQVPDPTGAVTQPGAGGPNSNPQMDAMDQFMTNLPDQVPGMQNQPMPGPQNQPPGTMGQQVAGPKPRMIDNRTGGPLGPLTPPQQHAGTFGEQQEMPEEPPAGAGSMPQIGQGQDDGMSGMASVMPGAGQEEDQMNADAEGQPPPNAEPDGDEGAGPGMGDGDGDEDDQPGADAGLQSGDSFSWDPSLLDEEEGMGEEEPTAPDANPQDNPGPTPGASESEPGQDAGPSTEDKPPFPPKPHTDPANKSLSAWLESI